jgi:hypothetical protein
MVSSPRPSALEFVKTLRVKTGVVSGRFGKGPDRNFQQGNSRPPQLR